MKKVLNILFFVFIGLTIFYLFKLEFSEDLFSETNQAYTYSIVFSLLGLLITAIVIQAGKIKLSKK